VELPVVTPKLPMPTDLTSQRIPVNLDGGDLLVSKNSLFTPEESTKEPHHLLRITVKLSGGERSEPFLSSAMLGAEESKFIFQNSRYFDKARRIIKESQLNADTLHIYQ
jgi:hypothetical protein